MVLVKNTRPRLCSIPLPAARKTIQLVPGVNQVPDDLWELAESQERVKVALDLGEIEVERKRVNDDNPLKTLSASKALKLIAETYNVKLLQTWRESEGRKPIVEAIDVQLEEIERATKPKNTEQGG